MGRLLLLLLFTAAPSRAASPQILQQNSETDRAFHVTQAAVDQIEPRRLAEFLVSHHESTSPPRAYSPTDIEVNFATADTEIQIWFDGNTLSRILEIGVLNVHESETTRSEQYRKSRLALEVTGLRAALFRQDPENRFAMPPDRAKLFPRYGVISYAGDLDLGPTTASPWEEYGAFAAILKDEVKRRTTWTAGDSLLGAGGFNPLSKGFVNPRWKKVYFEAQIWGPLDASDIEAILVPDNVTPEQLRLIEGKGLRAYFYETTKVAQRLLSRRVRPAGPVRGECAEPMGTLLR